ncbi:type II toxin-antitoxin system CcdA family antitoxin [Limobrevibacterium gyesilva]|uniref:Type II toxin-antitoxin system CcdA family antitoxin n=1 Tax=Limobrevibacterium gyesilva TaxID=2991712 RepID=A0AA41YNQ3_9PROT|nr:type II toxin-antitoxin system CcdA family antitoxin [Limobrevibacterium gyesilva]MCW3476904.1 type II toxin-antitoxin system CcdA family antitoxin [Limobrevibacterium gyesilva]
MPLKARTNVSIDAELLDQARALDINLSATLENRLREVVAERRRQRWLAANRGALADANAFLAERGLWSDGQRQF